MFKRFLYFLKQGIKHIFGHKIMSVASICIVAASLSLLGIFVSAGLNIDQAMTQLGDSREMNIYLSENAAGRSIEEIEEDLLNIEGVKEVRFFSREDRLKKVTEEVYGEDGYAFTDDENPLRDSYIVTVDDLASSDIVCDRAKDIKGVEEILRSSDIIGGIDTLTNGVRNIGIWITILLLVIALFIISNTIKLGMVNSGAEIKIMRAIGATNNFIIMPFVIEAFILGVIGALVSSLVTIFGYNALIGKVSELISSDVIKFVDYKEVAKVIVPLFFIVGAFLGAVGSMFATRRYLKD